MNLSETALCKGLHSELFFPPILEDRTGPEVLYHQIAKMVCEQCPVQSECLQDNKMEAFGVWGMTTPRERRRGILRHPPNMLPSEYVKELPRNKPDSPLDITSLTVHLQLFIVKRSHKKRVTKHDHDECALDLPNQRTPDDAGGGSRSSKRVGMPQAAALLNP